MKKTIFYLFLMVTTLQVSCSKSELAKEFPCDPGFERSETKKFKDVKKKFKIRIPKDWKTELYYDEYVSEIFSADTTKQLSESYIIDVVWHLGEMEINRELISKIKAHLDSTQMKTIREAEINFKNFPAYYNLAKGKFNNIDYHLLQVLIKTKPDEYISFQTKVYGPAKVMERICESVGIYENFTLIE